MPFNLFHKKKQQEQETPAAPTQEEPAQPTQEAPTLPVEETKPAETTTPTKESTPVAAPAPEVPIEPAPAQPEQQPAEQPAAPIEQKQEAPAEPASKTYLKAMPLKDLADVENVKEEVRKGNIIILRVTPLAGKSIEDVKKAVNDLFQFAEFSGGDIARLGEERVVICPKSIRIWREKTPAPVASQSLPTAA